MDRIYFILLLLGLSCHSALAADAPQARQGILDLRHWDFQNEGPVTLRGEWDFVWQSFFQTSDGASSRPAREDFRFIPGFWNYPDSKGKAFPVYGFASYHLHVILPEGEKKWAIDVAPFFTSGELYVDGQLLWAAGKTGPNKASSDHSMQGTIVFFSTTNNALDIDINIANFVHPKAGIGRLRIGPASQQAIERESRLAIYTFILGMIVIMGLYHIGLFLLRPADRSPLYFSFSCFANFIWAMTATGLIFHVAPHLNNELYWKIFYISWFIGYPVFAQFIKSIFPLEFSQRFVNFCYALSGLGTVWVLFTNFEWNEKIAIVFQIFGLLHFGYMFYAVLKAQKRGRSHALLLNVGMTIYFGFIMHDVLASEGLIDQPMMSPYGLAIYFGFQSYFLAARFSKAFSDLAIKEAEIMELNAGLERKVEEKTRDIRSILQSIQQGIFMIKRSSHSRLGFHSDYSQFLVKMLGRSDLSDKDPVDMIFDKADVTAEQKAITRSIIESSLGEPSVAFDLNAANLIGEIQNIRPEQQKASWEVDWTPIVASDDTIDKILVSIRDVTTIRQLQTEAVEQQKELEYISEIVNIAADSFEKFIKMSRSFIEENQRLIGSNPLKDNEVIKILFINMHTIKGNARSYKFRKMTGIIHDVEHEYARLLNQEDAIWDQVQLLRELKKVEDLINKYDSINRVKLGRSFQENQVMLERQVVADQINSLNLLDLNALNSKDKAIIEMTKATFSRVFYNSALDVFESLLNESERLARDLHKDTPTIVIDDPGFGLSLEAQELIRSVFTHIVRNSLDHGIELPNERVAKGKRPSGQLLLKLEERNGHLIINYRDDGRGLNLSHLKEVGVKRGVLEAGRHYAHQTLADLIFIAGLSTSTHLSDISGRGVGMDAVQRFIRKVGGDIKLCLIQPSQEPGTYTQFYLEIELPSSYYSRPSSDMSSPSSVGSAS